MVAGTARMGVGAAMPWDAKIGCRGAAGAVIALTMTASATVSSICFDFIGTLSYLSATSLIAGIPLHRLPIPYPPLALLLAELFVTVVMMPNKILRQSISKRQSITLGRRRRSVCACASEVAVWLGV